MLAIHNAKVDSKKFSNAANAFAKLSKCQQFTTILYLKMNFFVLQTLLQSYQNVSNSQLIIIYCNVKFCCKRFCKVIKMLAIHNQQELMPHWKTAANAFAKLSKCQQFTTRASIPFFFIELQTLLQSYQNVSNSQHKTQQECLNYSCKRFCKVIKMLAIHN